MNCRICKSEITNGTLCNRCLKTANEELLTVEERRQRNDNINLKSTIFFILGYLLGIPGFFLLFFVMPLGVLMLILGVVFYISAFVVTKDSVCPACQRRGSLEDMEKELTGKSRTTVKERQKIVRTQKGGGYLAHERQPETYEMEVNVPAEERYYKITYKCNKCGYVGSREETETVKL